ncbi:MAG TPA: RNase adapter RapZ [Clostridiaceae bacterium]|nr:RNase adapter RapZ [Clostridiaceae bacterium]
MTELVIVTGMSGGGKSMVASHLEDLGYFCIDNLPPQLVTELMHVFNVSEKDNPSQQKLALVTDMRSPNLVKHLLPELAALKNKDIHLRLLFLDASDETLVSRYKQTRRNHPLAKDRTLSEAIVMERQSLQTLRDVATDVVDTSAMSNAELRDVVFELFGDQSTGRQLSIVVQSFGFKYGVPFDCDNVMDVRFIPNPFYIPELRPHSGLDEDVRRYVFDFAETHTFLDHQKAFYEFVLPFYVREGKVRLSIGVGCTGGRHRSVALAEALAQYLKELGYRVIVDHRDLAKDHA